MTSSNKGILPQNYGFDKGLPLWKSGFHNIVIPIFYDGGGDMQEVNGSSLFDLGQIYNLGLIPLGDVVEYKFIVTHSIELLRNFGKLPFSYRLPHTVEMANNIANELERWIQTDNPNFNADGRNTLIRNLDQIRTLLFSELAKLTAILLEERGGRSVDTLWREPLKLLSEDVVPHLSDFVKENFGEAARCLVLDCCTSVGFHAMRSIEHASRKYYELIIGKPPIVTHKSTKEQDMGLGQIANELIAKYTSRENNKPRRLPSGDLGIIANTIHALCKNYRDPLSHPDIEKLDQNQAATTLNQTIEVISSIVIDAKNGGDHFATSWAGGPF